MGATGDDWHVQCGDKARGGVARSIGSLNEQRLGTDGATGSDRATCPASHTRHEGTVRTRHVGSLQPPIAICHIASRAASHQAPRVVACRLIPATLAERLGAERAERTESPQSRSENLFSLRTQ